MLLLFYLLAGANARQEFMKRIPNSNRVNLNGGLCNGLGKHGDFARGTFPRVLPLSIPLITCFIHIGMGRGYQ